MEGLKMIKIKEFPDKILLIKDGIIEDYWVLKNLTQYEDAEYIRKDIVNEMLNQAFLAGQAVIKEQFEKIENYQEEGWYSSGDDEYVYGISFDKPIKLPVEFYVKKK